MNNALLPATHPRIVLKIGSSLLVGPDGTLRREWLATLAADIANRRKSGQQIIIVSSGAIALGSRQLHMPKRGRATLEDAQAAAAVGQIALAQGWGEALAAHAITAAQILLTLGDLEDRRRYLNAAATLDRLLALGVIPVINENDTVATEEIRFGDNDRLAARVAQAAGANGLILFSDVDGLYSADPARNPDAKRFETIDALTDEHRAMATANSASGIGSGGMETKLAAAQIAAQAGADMVIVSGKHPHPLARLEQEQCGTLFRGGTARDPRKAWMAGRLTVVGSLTIDAGALAALNSGASLLAVGVRTVSGPFERGDIVAILGPDGNTIAHGLAEYDASDAAKIIGLGREGVAEALGYAPRSAMVHRDHMALL
ncbi:MAG: glutamate 5-kinase [Sphingopyxis sp.]